VRTSNPTTKLFQLEIVRRDGNKIMNDNEIIIKKGALSILKYYLGNRLHRMRKITETTMRKTSNLADFGVPPGYK
jgi:hypothetical protein